MAYMVLALAFLLERATFAPALRQVRPAAPKQARPDLDQVLNSSNTTMRSAFAGSVAHQPSGSGIPNSIGSRALGLLLGAHRRHPHPKEQALPGWPGRHGRTLAVRGAAARGPYGKRPPGLPAPGVCRTKQTVPDGHLRPCRGQHRIGSGRQAARHRAAHCKPRVRSRGTPDARHRGGPSLGFQAFSTVRTIRHVRPDPAA